MPPILPLFHPPPCAMDGARGREPRTTTPNANGNTRMSKAKLETVRAAALAAHNAAGYLWQEGDAQCARLLRTAEALSRQALAILQAPPKQDDASPPQPGKAPRAKRNRKKKDKKDEKRVQEKKEGDRDIAMGESLEPAVPQNVMALVQEAPAGASVLVGDLRELGTDAATLVVPPSSTSSRLSPPSGAGSLAPQRNGGAAASGASEPAALQIEAQRVVEERKERVRKALLAVPVCTLRDMLRQAGLAVTGGRRLLVDRLFPLCRDAVWNAELETWDFMAVRTG